ncbi:MAG: hypothetical protein KatS3mg131_3447 [Candidatus Tectimicrobiota bacterium]|nr:MAG: hypothetical protein KatS3mg131_3447 [Candidatus Tectomicrobia bacterium]
MTQPVTPRIAPLPPDAWDAELRARFERPGGLGQIFNVMQVLANHPALLRRWVVLANHVLFKSTLPPRHRELLILRTAWLADCAYEWAQHRRLATEAGLSAEEIAAVAAEAPDARWSPLEAALLRAADGLYLEAFVDDATWAALAAHYDERQLLDVLFTAGNYLLLAMALNSFGVPLDAGYTGFDPGLPRNRRHPSPHLPPLQVPRPVPRLAPLPEAAWTPAQRELLAKAHGPLPTVNVLDTLVRHPDLLRRWLPFFTHMLHKSTLPPRHREILILRTGRLCGAAYEWAQHLPFARRAGLSEAEIRTLAAAEAAAAWPVAHEQALVRAAEQLHRQSTLDDATWAALAAQYTTPQLMDVVFTVGQYRLVATVLNSLCVQLDPYLQFPEV